MDSYSNGWDRLQRSVSADGILVQFLVKYPMSGIEKSPVRIKSLPPPQQFSQRQEYLPFILLFPMYVIMK
jgi:hypothetical protein